jgi:DNA excision repair protein ERCC-2
MVISNTKQARYRLNVRQAADLLCQTGDLSHRERAVATALEGQDVHRRMQASWPSGIEKEVKLKWRFEERGVSFDLGGRVDGLQVQQKLVRYLEIKTLRHPPEQLPKALQMRHRLQVLLYAHLWRLQHPLHEADTFAISLIYYDTLQHKTSELSEHYSPNELSALTDPLIACLQEWFVQLFRHRQARDLRLHDITFPFAFRSGQRAFATQVFRTIRDQQQALIEAPTGSGKSLATLFPALKAMATGHIDQIIVSTARNSTQQAALDSIGLLALDQPELRTLQLTAKDKICVQDSVCNWMDCPRQIGFFERLDAARQECLQRGYLPASELRDIALRHEICPHGLQSHLQPWCDVLTGDYNYVFSPAVRSEFLFSFNRTVLLIDEAHNLPDRARELFSAQLDSAVFTKILALQNTLDNPLAKATRMLLAELTTFNTEADNWRGNSTLTKKMEAYLSCAEHWLLSPHDLLTPINQEAMRATETGLQQVRQWLLTSAKAADDFVCFDASYSTNDESARLAIGELSPSSYLDNPHQDASHPFWPHQYSAAKTNGRERGPKSGRSLYLRCLSPARMLQPCFAASTASILFSATLTPPDFYQQLLGLPNELTRSRLPSAFDKNLSTIIAAPYINMRSKARNASLPTIVDMIATTYRVKPGNYWVYTPSFEYQTSLAAIFAEAFPDIEVACQLQGAQTGQPDFLARFTLQSQVIGFTVLGGVFGEGVDLPGDRLIGAIILGPGLPQMSLINDRIAEYFKGQKLDGFAYAYQLPGWQKVVQAAGRVIRTASDRGVVILADDRFTQASYKELMPSHWQLQICRSNNELNCELLKFWQSQGS